MLDVSSFDLTSPPASASLLPMIAKILHLPILTVEATLASNDDPETPVFQLIARHSVVRRVLESNQRCSVFTHTLAMDYPLGFEDAPPQEAKWTSRANVPHDPLDRLYLALRATRYTRLHLSRLWRMTDQGPEFPGA
jgi:hypothetical protein